MTRNGAKPKVRAAGYTRKSSEEGLDQEFNSLDAQHAAGEAYVASQSAEGWLLVPDRYDDGAISGATLDRPALKRLLTDVEARKIDDDLVIHQLIASGIAHPPPPRLYTRGLGLLSWLGEDVLPDCRQSLHPLPGRRRIFTDERNWLTIERRHGDWQASWTTEHGGPTPPLILGRRSKS